MSKLILFNKPYNVLSQFTDKNGRATLSNYLNLPQCEKCYCAGRLDRDSEGLLLLTDDGKLQHKICHPKFKLEKTYWVQVEGEPTADNLKTLQRGVRLKDGPSRALKIKPIKPPEIWHRKPPIRSRKNILTSWLELTINEGRNRQVRRMTAALDLPTLRLIRIKIGGWKLENLAPGEYTIQQVFLPAGY